MDKEYELDIKRADETSALSDFYCGIESMDIFIHDKENGLEKFIRMRLSNLWIVYEKDKAVAFFALSKDALMLNNEDRRMIERDEEKKEALVQQGNEEKFWEKEKFPAIEIDYFAVCKEKREAKDDHLGTFLIDSIAQMGAEDELSSTLFLTVEALDTREYSAVDFYRRCDFEFSDKARNKDNYLQMMSGEQPSTRRMYKIIYPLN